MDPTINFNKVTTDNQINDAVCNQLGYKLTYSFSTLTDQIYCDTGSWEDCLLPCIDTSDL